jgi:predicted MFS family arabinose efflux permease
MTSKRRIDFRQSDLAVLLADRFFCDIDDGEPLIVYSHGLFCQLSIMVSSGKMMNSTIESRPLTEHTSRAGFWSLAWAQFFGAVNDNILKVVLVFTILYGVWSGILGKGAEAQSYVNYLFTIPFIVLSGYAGIFSDRNSKSNVVLWVKIIEIPIVVVAAIGFWTQNLWIALSALLALTCQSAYFGPAKYGMIPEIVAAKDLSRANGLINMMTNIAVIIGTLVAGQIATYYSPNAAAIDAGVTPHSLASRCCSDCGFHCRTRGGVVSTKTAARRQKSRVSA